MTEHDLLIIGAGIAGLSMAHHAARAGWNVRVLEREHRPGGCLHSHCFATGVLEDFWIELGAHSAFNSYGHLLTMLESIQALDRLQKRPSLRFRLFASGQTHSIPSQLYIPELLLAPLRVLGKSKAGQTVADYYRPIVGPRNYAAVFQPAFDAVLCQPASDYPASSLFRPRSRRKGVPRSFTFPGGLQGIARLLAEQTGIQLGLAEKAQAIHRDGQRFVVQTDRAEYAARALSVATPVAVAAELLAPLLPALASELAGIEMAIVESVGVVLPHHHVRRPPFAGLIGRDEAFYSVVSRDIVPDAQFRGFTFHFRPGVLSEEQQRACMARVLDVAHTELGPENTASCINQLPMLRVSDLQRIGRMDRLLVDTRLALTGNYFGGISIEDCISRSAAEFMRLQREGL